MSPREWNLIFAMPFFFMVAIYQPFIYFVIELEEGYGLDAITVGLLMSAFHLCRLVAIAGSMVAPKASHFLGTAVGMAGYLCLIFFWDTPNVAIFASCNVAAGFAEASAVVFVYSKEAYETDIENMMMAMRYQSASIGVGVIAGFLVGGVVLNGFGIGGAATVGAVSCALELASLVYFLVDPPTGKHTTQEGNDSSGENESGGIRTSLLRQPTTQEENDSSDGIFKSDGNVDPNENRESEGRKERNTLQGERPSRRSSPFLQSLNSGQSMVRRSSLAIVESMRLSQLSLIESMRDSRLQIHSPLLHQSSLVESISDDSAKNNLLDEYSGSKDIAPSKFTYVVAFIFSFDTIACGYLYTIGPLFMFNVFGIDEGTIGIIFSIGSFFGSLFTFLALSSRGRHFQKNHLRSPCNIYTTVIVGSLAVIGLLIPDKYAHILCVILVHIALELFLTLIAELQGGITTSRHFAKLGPVSQMSRKLLNIVMALTGPIMYNAFSRLPYVVSGALCAVYALTFIFFAQKQQRDNEKLMAEFFAWNKDVDATDENKLIQNYRHMDMMSNECLARIADFHMRRKMTDPVSDDSGDDDDSKSNLLQ